MEHDLPIDHPLLDGLPACDPKLVVALVLIREESGVECIASLLARLRAEAVEGVTVKLLSPPVLKVTFNSTWARGDLIVVAGRRAVRLFRESWSASNLESLADSARSTATQAGCAVGAAASLLMIVLLLSALSEDRALEGRVRVVTLIVPFLIPPLMGAGLGTVIGVRIGRRRAERARKGPRTLEQDVAARDALVARVIATLKGISVQP